MTFGVFVQRNAQYFVGDKRTESTQCLLNSNRKSHEYKQIHPCVGTTLDDPIWICIKFKAKITKYFLF